MTSLSPDLPDEPPPGPAPFVLTIGVPAGLPWDQWRQARLEAEHSAPLPIDQLRYDLRRIGRWRPGQPGLFATAFFHNNQVAGELSHGQEVGGEFLKFTIRDDASGQRERFRKWGPLVCGALGGATIAASILLAASDREEANSALEAQRLEAQRVLAARERAQRRLAESRALGAIGVRGSRLSDALDDIGWLSRARDPAATIRAVEWTPSAMTITAAGPSNPIVARDRAVQPASAPGATSQWVVPTRTNQEAPAAP